MNIEQAKQYSIVDYLKWKGYEPIRKRGKELFFFSPLRPDNCPSFAVDPEKNVWADYGETGTRPGNKVKGGAIHQLAAELCGSMSAGLKDIANFAGVRTPTTHPLTESIKPSSKIKEHNHKLIEHPSLLKYLKDRNISILPARLYCREIWYTNESNQRKYFAIGFKSNSEGWELSAPGFKGALGPKDITLITNRSKIILVFEGFFDMLSIMSYLGTKEKIDRYNWLCLNSVALISKAIPRLKEYEDIRLYLDNDEGGTRATKAILEYYPSAKDCRPGYSQFNDVNDWWINQTKK